MTGANRLPEQQLTAGETIHRSSNWQQVKSSARAAMDRGVNRPPEQ